VIGGSLPVDQLHAALTEVRRDWTLPSSYATNGVHHGYQRIVLIAGGRWWPTAEPFRFALEQYNPIREAFISQLQPGGFIAPHRDAPPWYERWQIPIHAAGRFDDARPTDGVPFRVTHWLPHFVANDTDRPRVHLVIDRDIELDLPPAPFETFPMPDELADMVSQATAGA
jgi:hypothetical protein